MSKKKLLGHLRPLEKYTQPLSEESFRAPVLPKIGTKTFEKNYQAWPLPISRNLSEFQNLRALHPRSAFLLTTFSPAFTPNRTYYQIPFPYTETLSKNLSSFPNTLPCLQSANFLSRILTISLVKQIALSV